MEAIRDLFQGLGQVSLWTTFAWDEIEHRYRRSYLGVIWIVLSYLIFVAAIAIFFGGFSAMENSRFTVYVAVNYAIFIFLIGNVTDGCDVFRVAQTWIKSAPIPHSVYIYKSIARSLFTFGINVTVALVLAFAMGWQITVYALFTIPALAVILLNTIWVQIVLGYLSARLRDLKHLVQAVTRVLFFTTPILWVREEREGLVGTIADLNPFTHFLEIFAAPLLGRYPHLGSWIIVGAITVCGYLLAIVVAGYSRKRLAYWL